jgi:tetratricopeptide (TPR) repeat protein
MEQPHVPPALSVSIVTMGRALSDEARASLEAIRVAQEAARLRARRQTAQTRLWFLAFVGAVVLAGFAVGPRIARTRQARAAHAATSAHAPLVAASAPVAPATSSPPAEAPRPEPAARSAAEPAPVAVPAGTAQAQAQAKPHSAAAAAAAAADAGCDTTLVKTAPWRLSPEACARAFESDPTNAALALAIAHAEHGNARFAEAAQWAKRALALDANAAEAYVMIARADAKEGRHDDARAAYRRYLELAPRGWHQAEARAAVRRARTTASADSARAR